MANALRLSIRTLFVWGFVCFLTHAARAQDAANLGGTSWELVKFHGGDQKTLTPADSTKYTVAFGSDGRVSVRIDCNRGHGSWKSSGPNELQFGPLALTRAMCPPAPLSDRIVKDWPRVRSYILKDDHLFLSVIAHGGTYEFEPISNHDENAVIPGLPASFFANLPCADCPGIRYQVNLFPDHWFVSRMIYEERNTTTYNNSGHWLFNGETKMLVLQSEHGASEKFLLKDSDMLRKLDVNGHEIKSKLNYDLKRAPKFIRTEPSRSATDVSLENTYWKLVRLNNVQFDGSAEARAHLTFDGDSHRVSGSGGCNQITGSYEASANRLTFSKMVTTMMACAQGMDTEKSFLNALTQVRAWKIEGHELSLLDGSGEEVARLEAGE